MRLGNLFWSQYIPADQILVSPITRATASPVHFQSKFWKLSTIETGQSLNCDYLDWWPIVKIVIAYDITNHLILSKGLVNYPCSRKHFLWINYLKEGRYKISQSRGHQCFIFELDICTPGNITFEMKLFMGPFFACSRILRIGSIYFSVWNTRSMM